MRGMTVSVGVMVLCVVISHVQTAVCLTPEGQGHRVVMVIVPTDHRNKNNVTSSSKQRHRRHATKSYDNKDVAGLSKEEKQIIVDIHNEYRAKQGASDMMYMTWDDDLGNLAQSWADKCYYNNSPNERRQNVGEFSKVGENLYAGTGSYDPARVVELWYDEFPDYNYDTASCDPSKVCGHYTQMVWANSYAVGCGVKYCSDLEGFQYGAGFVLVCNYGPAGNYRSQKPFKKGEACSACGEDRPYCVQSMCSTFQRTDEPTGGATPRAPLSWFLIGYTIMSTIMAFMSPSLLP